MNSLLKAFTTIMVAAVFIGMAMELGSIFTFPRIDYTKISSTVAAVFRAVLPEGNPPGIPDRMPPAAEKDRTLRMSPEMVAQLRNTYANSMHDPGAQVEAIGKIEQYLISEFPKTWKQRKFEALNAVFPKDAERLYRMSGKVDAYNAWLDANWGILLNMRRSERNRILWGKRQEIFGVLAQDIWRDDVKDEAIYAVMDGLNKVKGASLEEKTHFFVSSIRQAYEGKADAFIKARRHALLDGFLGLESVQNDLRAMPPDQRRQGLIRIRESLGMEESELRKWDELEKAREERWGKGIAYMKEREKISRSQKDDAREQTLAVLRKQYFGKDAEIIMHEEEAGFFRFNVKRVYGKN